MDTRRPLSLLMFAVIVAVIAACASADLAHAQGSRDGAGTTSQGEAHRATPPVDRSGRKQIGTASVYSHRFAGRTMADRKPMDPRDDNAASKTLPLGTKARVTNLGTGQSATVTIQDRGPYVKGRILDVSPATAEKIGITPKQGVTQVEVAPIALPPRDEPAKH